MDEQKHDEVTKKLLVMLVEESTERDVVDFIEAGVVELLSQAWIEFVKVDPGPGMSYLTDQDYRMCRNVAYQLVNKLKEEA